MGKNSLVFKTSDGECITVKFHLYGTVFKTSLGFIKKPGDVIIKYHGDENRISSRTIFKYVYDELDEIYHPHVYISKFEVPPQIHLDIRFSDNNNPTIKACMINLGGGKVFTTDPHLVKEDQWEKENGVESDGNEWVLINLDYAELENLNLSHKDIYEMRKI